MIRFHELSPVTQSSSIHRPDLIGKRWRCHWNHETNEPLQPVNHTHTIVDAYEDSRINLTECRLCLMLDNGMHIKGIHSQYIAE